MQVIWCLDEMSKSSRPAPPAAVDPQSAIKALLYYPDPGNVPDQLVKRFAEVNPTDVPKVETVLQRLGYNQHLIDKLFFKAPQKQRYRYRHQDTPSSSASCRWWVVFTLLLLAALQWAISHGWFDQLVPGARSPWSA